MAKAEKKSVSSPDETRKFEKGKVELVTVAGQTVGHYTFEPGWRWSQHVKPIAKTELCQAPHFGYQTAGTMHVVLEDGSEFDVKPGDVYTVPPGHDAWTVGNETVMGIDVSGMANYAK